MQHYDLTIIGAGIIGLSIAHCFMQEQPGIRIVILEREMQINRHQTGRNSGVIHSGIYYRKGSYKSKNCLEGYRLMLQFLQEQNLPYKITGKAIVATNEREVAALQKLYDNALSCGLKVSYMEQSDLQKMQSGLQGEKAVWVSETGITNYGLVAERLLQLLKAGGAEIIYSSALQKVTATNGGYEIQAGSQRFFTKLVVNAAGLQSDRVYKTITGKKSPVTIVPFKGEYYKLKPGFYQSEIPIYPVPNPDFPFLGIHITRMLDGTVKLGPNAVLVLDRHAYEHFGFNWKDALTTISTAGLYKVFFKYGKTAFNELLKQTSKDYFKQSVQKYWKDFDWEMVSGYASGIRAQAINPNGLVDDFVYEVTDNQIHILNAPSPAATSCFSIAKQAYELYNDGKV